MITPEKDGAPQAWADKLATAIVNKHPRDEIARMRDDFARALKTTREKTLLEAIERLGGRCGAAATKDLRALIEQEPEK